MRNQEKKKYYLEQSAEIEEIKQLSQKPTLLMHTCCGVCVGYHALYLSKINQLSSYYKNDTN